MKELPYFQFYYSDWLTGNIQIADHTTKGIFIDLCAYYWKNDCNLTVEDAQALLRPDKQCFSNAIGMLKRKQIIAIDKQDRIIIKFLDEQFQNLLNAHKKRVNSGRKGGQAKSKKQSLSNAKPMQKHIISDSDSLDVLNKGGTGENDNRELKLPKGLDSPEIKKALIDWIDLMEVMGNTITAVQMDLHYGDLLRMKDPEVILEAIRTAIKKQWKAFYKPHDYQSKEGFEKEVDEDIERLKRRAERNEN